jgi:hypothetical protein
MGWLEKKGRWYLFWSGAAQVCPGWATGQGGDGGGKERLVLRLGIV